MAECCVRERELIVRKRKRRLENSDDSSFTKTWSEPEYYWEKLGLGKKGFDFDPASI